MEIFGPPEKVYVENEWYDGPRLGIADIKGIPHRFKSLFDEEEGEYLGAFVVWPVDNDEFDLEVSQWNIFVAWNLLYESGKEPVDSHPGHGGINQKYDEINTYLKSRREKVPTSARRAKAKM